MNRSAARELAFKMLYEQRNTERINRKANRKLYRK